MDHRHELTESLFRIRHELGQVIEKFQAESDQCVEYEVTREDVQALNRSLQRKAATVQALKDLAANLKNTVNSN